MFFLLTVKFFVAAGVSASLTLASLLRWLWTSDPAPSERRYEIGDGIRLPDAMTGPRSHAAWAVFVLIAVDAAILASLVFSYFYLWDRAERWPNEGSDVPGLSTCVLAAIAWIASSVLVALAGKALRMERQQAFIATLLGALGAMGIAFAIMVTAIGGTGASAKDHSYGATMYALLAWQGVHVILLAMMGVFTIARMVCGLLTDRRRATFDHTRWLWDFMVVQAVIVLLVILFTGADHHGLMLTNSRAASCGPNQSPRSVSLRALSGRFRALGSFGRA